MFFLLLITGAVSGQQFSGLVLDSITKQPVPFATVYVVELHTGATANSEGTFILSASVSGQVHLQISCIGYQTNLFQVDLSQDPNATFLLLESHLQLNEVVVSGSSVKLQQENTVSVVQKNMSELNQNSPVNLTEAISNIAGVDNYSTGSGIGKPVIRGLLGNRVVVYAQNVRLENQQWGEEHGLGIGGVGIENVELIKGASSLLYGADAIGGVLYFTDERYASLNSLQGFIASRFLSNTLGSFNDAGIKFNIKNFRMNLFGSFNSNADYRLPGSSRVLNTRFNEKNIKASLGYNFKNWIGNLRYSFLRNDLGITLGDSMTQSTEHGLLLPFQEIDNQLLTFENLLFFGKTKLTATFGYNHNDRKEFEDSATISDLNLVLRTLSYHIRSSSAFLKGKLNLITGLQGMYQQNANKAAEVLVPDALVNDIGGFVVLSYAPSGKLTFEGGMRLDNRIISTTEMQTPDTYFPGLDRSFTNFNFGFGSSYRIRTVGLKMNISTGFRAPNTFELLSNGVHEGVLRYEIGASDLKSEQVTQMDLDINYEKEHVSFYVSAFLNHMNNYIFLSPSDSFINNLPVYHYLQTQADLTGGELGFHLHPHPIDWIHFESNYSGVFGADRSGNALPLIPANKIQTTVKGEFKAKGKAKVERIFIEHIYRFRQDRIADYETSSPSHHLLNVGLVLQIIYNENDLEITGGVKNVLNTRYIDHLSRLKPMGIENAGLNVYFGLKWKFRTRERQPKQ